MNFNELKINYGKEFMKKGKGCVWMRKKPHVPKEFHGFDST